MEKIVLEHITYIYGDGTPFRQVALDDVSIAIRENRVTGVIGHTGSGKSTMMQLLNGLAKPTSGKILLDGYDINTEPDEVFDAWRKLPGICGSFPQSGEKSDPRGGSAPPQTALLPRGAGDAVPRISTV